MIKCVTGKKVYQTEELAEEALIGAHTRFDYKNNQGPIAVYKCSDCRYYHLTSRGPINVKLKQQLETGEINRQKRADDWLNKLKHKR
jgi:hypothetical protein